MSARRFGAQSMTAPLREVVVKRPGAAFACAFDDPRHGFRHPVDLNSAQREHDAFVELLGRLGVTVHQLEAETDSPDLIYTFDPLLVTDRGAIPLRSGKSSRLGEEAALEAWTTAHGVPTLGRIEAPGTVDGGDTFWLRPDLFCIGRSLRTNTAGAAQLASLVGGDVRIFDVPYAAGPDECLHLLSLLSPVTEDAVVAYLPLLPAGLHELLSEHAIEILPVSEEEFATQASNILAIRPGVLVMMAGNPQTERLLRRRGCEVHTYEADEIGVNGSGGPTCLTRPILREAPRGQTILS
jgi:dimethylargininase